MALTAIVALAAVAYLAADGNGRPSASPGPQSASLGTAAGSPGPSSLAPLASADGVIVFAGDKAGSYDIWAAMVDGSGLRPLTKGSARERGPDVSPDGSTIIFEAGRIGQRDIYRINADGSGRTRLTNSSKDDYAPAFSPDGLSIAWTSDRSGDNDIWVMTDTGNGFVEDLARNATAHPAGDNNHDDVDPSWLPDGQRVAFASSRADSSDIWVVDAFRDSLPRARTLDRLPDHQPAVGPGGEIAFVGERDTKLHTDIYVMPQAGDAPERLTDTAAVEALPDYSPDGDELVFAESRSPTGTRLVTMTSDGKREGAIPVDMPNAVDPTWVTRLGTE